MFVCAKDRVKCWVSSSITSSICVCSVCKCVHVCMQVYVYTRGGQRSLPQLLFSLFVRQGAPVISILSQLWNDRQEPPPLTANWVLGSQTQVLVLVH